MTTRIGCLMAVLFPMDCSLVPLSHFCASVNSLIRTTIQTNRRGPEVRKAFRYTDLFVRKISCAQVLLTGPGSLPVKGKPIKWNALWCFRLPPCSDFHLWFITLQAVYLFLLTSFRPLHHSGRHD